MTNRSDVDKIVNMKIQDILSTLVSKNGLRKTARELGIDAAALYRNINSDMRVSTAKKILDLFGYDLRIVKRRR